MKRDVTIVTPTLHVEEMEVCALCNVYVGEGTAKAKKLRLFGDSAVDTREQMDMFLYQELGVRFLIANSIAPSIFRTERVSYEFY